MGDIILQNNSASDWQGTANGRQVTIGGNGGKQSFADICELATFMHDNGAGPQDSESGEVTASLNRQAEDANCTHRFNAVALPAGDGPTDGPPGPGGDTAEDQGAPQIPPQGQLSQNPEPYGSPTEPRQPTEALHDQTDPRPEGEIGQAIENGQGSRGTGADPAEELERARRGDPPEGEPRHTHSGDTPDAPTTAGDPIDLYSGAFVLTAHDLEVPTPFGPLSLTRSYRSGRPYFGPMGFNWDHNWNVYLRELTDGGIARWNGRLHEDRFRRDGAGWSPPRGVFEVIEPLPGPRVGYVIHGPGGTIAEFERPPGWTLPERIPLVHLADRAGNAVTLTYDAADRLARVQDDDGRGFAFTYGNCGFLERVEDHSGRLVRYWHDDTREHLVAVHLPDRSDPDAASPTGPPHAIYDYAAHNSHPAQRHNILRVRDGAGNTVTQNVYGLDPAGGSFNRVLTQIEGGFHHRFCYTLLQALPNDPLFRDAPASQTEAVYPDRSLWTYTFNSAGDLIDERLRLNIDKSFRVTARQQRFDTAGNLVEEVAADGSRTLRVYDDTNADPRARGNLLRLERAAGPLFPVPSRILMRIDHEPNFQLIHRIRHEGGAETRYSYDFDLAPAPGNIGALLRVDWPTCTLPDGTAQDTATVFEVDARGLVTAAITPEGSRDEYTYRPAGGPDSGFLDRHVADATGAALATTYDYDAAGFLASVTAPGGGMTRHATDARGRRIRTEQPAVAGAVDPMTMLWNDTGTLREFRYPRGGYDDSVIADDHIVETVEVDPLGRVARRVLGANTERPRTMTAETDFRGRPIEMTDPDGAVTRACFDERGLLLFATTGAGTDIAATVRSVRDRVGRVIAIVRPGERRTEVEYDPWGRVALTRFPDGTEERVDYGVYDLPVAVEVTGRPGPGLPPRLLRRVGVEYDERGRPVRTTLWRFVDPAGAMTPLSEMKWYDRDGRCRRRITPHGDEWNRDFDGLGRPLLRRDPLGNRVDFTYGPDGLPARTTETDIGPGGPLVRFTDHEHDARGRLFRTVTQSGQTMTATYDSRDLVVESVAADGTVHTTAWGLLAEPVGTATDPGGVSVTSRIETDAMGRPTRHIDAAGEETRIFRDALGRVTQVRLADGSTFGRSFDATTGDLTRITMPGGGRAGFAYDGMGRVVTVSATPGAGQMAVPDHDFAHDGLGRIVRATAGADTVTRTWDSLDRLISDDDGGGGFTRNHDDLALAYRLEHPDGRAEQHDLDPLGRVSRITLAAPGASALAGGGPAAGTVLLDTAYRGLHRIAELTGTAARDLYDHDEGGRLTGFTVDVGGATLVSTSYRSDAMNRRRLAQAGDVAVLTDYDADGRLTDHATGTAPAPLPPVSTLAEAEAQIAAAAVAAAVAQVFTYDAAGRRLSRAVTAGGATVTEPYAYSPAKVLASVDGAALASDADGNRRGGPDHAFRYDALGRLVEATGPGGALARLAYDPLGRPVRVEENGATELARWFGSHRLRLDDGTGAPVAILTQHPGLLEPSGMLTADGGLHLHYDGHHDLSLVSDAGGATVAAVRYGPFGTPETLGPDGAPAPLPSPLRPVFGAMRWLGPAGIYTTPKRPFDPATGMFLSRDPQLFASGPNPYAFAAHDPINGLDPDGDIAPLLAAGLIVGGIGAIIGAASVVVRGGDYDVWDVVAGAGIGFGAGFVTGVTFGWAASALTGGGLAAAGAAGATGAASGTAATAGTLGSGISVGAGIGAGAFSGAAGGTFSGFARANYQYFRHGGDYGAMVAEGVIVEGVSGLVGGGIGGGMFSGSLRLGALPAGQGFWASLSGQSTRLTMRDMAPQMVMRGLASPYGAGGVATGFASGYSSGATRRLMTGDGASDAFGGAVDDGWWGAAGGLTGAAMHPTSYVYWGARFSPTVAARIQQTRGTGAHHQRNVAQYPELSTPRLSRQDLTWFESFYGRNVIGGNLQGRYSEYSSPAEHRGMHNAWRFGQRGSWQSMNTHGPWTPPTQIYNPPADPRSDSHAGKD